MIQHVSIDISGGLEIDLYLLLIFLPYRVINWQNFTKKKKPNFYSLFESDWKFVGCVWNPVPYST